MGGGIYGGKYPKVRGKGNYGNNDAGVSREANPGEFNPIKREFVGSGTNEYTFYSENRGVLVVTAKNFIEAWRRAKTLGYSRKNYVSGNRGKK